MTKKQKRLAVRFLREWADELDNHSCNDLPKDVLADFTEGETGDLGIEFSALSHPPGVLIYEEEFKQPLLFDTCLVSLIAHLLEKEIDNG
jgi:hypothetical protein